MRTRERNRIWSKGQKIMEDYVEFPYRFQLVEAYLASQELTKA